MLARGERAHAVIRGEQRLRAAGVERGRRREAPVIDRDRDVEEQRVGARKIKIDDAADARAVPQHVVAKKIGMDGAAREFVAAVLRLEPDFGGQRGGCRRGEKRRDLLGRPPPTSLARAGSACSRRNCGRPDAFGRAARRSLRSALHRPL